MNKHILAVIIIAGILALLGAIAIFQVTRQQEIIEPKQEETIVPILESKPIQVEEEEIKQGQKQTSTNQIKKVSQRPTQSGEVIKELPEIKQIVVKEEETPVNENVIQEEESKDIVITKEYKIQTPARYTFK